MYKLQSGAILPLCGLGTFKSKGQDCTEACIAALQAGYTLIDTARVYRNEVEVGVALKQSGISRDKVFITTKIPPTEQGESAAYDAVHSSLANLGVLYIDLILIHWPGKAKTPLDSNLNAEARRGTWRALIRAKREGKVRDIGVSNFTISHLQDPCFQHPKLEPDESFCALPAVNQIECHPLCLQSELRAFCADQGIVVQAYSSLCCGDESVYNHPAMQALLASMKMDSDGLVSTPQQLLLVWGLQQRLPVIPKSKSALRISENRQFMLRVLKSMSLTELGDTLDGSALLDSHILPVVEASSLAELRGDADRHLCWDARKVL